MRRSANPLFFFEQADSHNLRRVRLPGARCVPEPKSCVAFVTSRISPSDLPGVPKLNEATGKFYGHERIS
jgi:hypothetical protein